MTDFQKLSNWVMMPLPMILLLAGLCVADPFTTAQVSDNEVVKQTAADELTGQNEDIENVIGNLSRSEQGGGQMTNSTSAPEAFITTTSTPKPTSTSTPILTSTPTRTSTPTLTSTPTPTSTPTSIPTPAPRCPGNQLPLRSGEGCGCPVGMVKAGEGNCTCPVGYVEEKPADCQDIDECKGEVQGPCGLHANCTNTSGSYVCNCLRGYLMGPGGCEDIDECALAEVTGLQACRSGAECRNTPGSFSCSCPIGYVMALDGQSCVDVDECSFEEQCRRELGNVCENTPGSFVCLCQPGFRAQAPACIGPVCPDYRVCQDVDECKEMPEVCVGQGMCENTLGSYRCVCQRGYRGNGTHCEDDNECASGRHGCDTNARCGNVIGSYFCQCYQGFSGDGHSCFDVDECALGNGRCEHVCTNEPGGYSCHCRQGYQLAQDGHNCTGNLGVLPCVESEMCRNAQLLARNV
uniref:EGF-like domain-containing protein n=1 Tax=Esox lucius TaxID=8010 RepID=A0A3P8XCC5_ESOLU